MNNYFKVLLYLKQFEGDGKFHEVESLLTGIDSEEKKEIFGALAREGLIHLDGGQYTGLPIIIGYRDGTSKTFGGDNIRYEPYTAILTFKGSKYLKEELEMEEKGKYNIKVDGNSTANVIIGSPGATINNKTEIIDKVKNIIKTIEDDNSIDASTRENAIDNFNQLLTEIEQGKKNALTIEKIFSLGGNISSIGSLVVSLIQLLAVH